MNDIPLPNEVSERNNLNKDVNKNKNETAIFNVKNERIESLSVNDPISNYNHVLSSRVQITSIPESSNQRKECNNSRSTIDCLMSDMNNDQSLAADHRLSHSSSHNSFQTITVVSAKLKSARSSLLILQKQLSHKSINANISKQLDNAVVDTTEAFLELLQLETMSSHLKEMRDRRLFLEKAADDVTVPEEEREVARWITDTYLRKSTSNFVDVSKITKRTLRPMNVVHENINNNNDDMHGLTNIINSVDECILSVDKHMLQPKVVEVLKCVDRWDFSVFEFCDLCGKSSLAVLMLTLCNHRRLFSEQLNVNQHKLIKYMIAVDDNYKDNPFHNHAHACDVTASMQLIYIFIYIVYI